MPGELRPWARDEASAHLSSLEAVEACAPWRWSFVDDAGRFVAAMAIVPDLGRCGWFVAYPGHRLRTAAQIRPMIREYLAMRASGVYTELRAWVASEDEQAQRFARWFGFRFDCGPATGLSPTGRDLDLYLWRQANGR